MEFTYLSCQVKVRVTSQINGCGFLVCPRCVVDDQLILIGQLVRDLSLNLTWVELFSIRTGVGQCDVVRALFCCPKFLLCKFCYSYLQHVLI